MTSWRWVHILSVLLIGTGSAPTNADGGDVSSLRLVPFPKEVQPAAGLFALDAPLVFAITPPEAVAPLGELVTAEMQRAGFAAPRVTPLQTTGHVAILAAVPEAFAGLQGEPDFRADATAEDYLLQVRPDGVRIEGKGPEGLFYGVHTLCQLVRANRRGQVLEGVTIRDWPSLRWRVFQDDLTRGPSSTLETLKQEVALGASLKHNLFTYYMEHQYAFSKHPDISPEGGCLLPEELKALVEYADGLHVGILGNQQSFAHFHHILKHEQYAALRENNRVLSPVNEDSYRLLDDLYSEVIPLLPLPFFNVCCDETQGLGEGPSKALAEQIGVGGVYARHVRRIHDLLKDKYGKRMMMWGDIILHHPEHLKEIPTDTIMLTWGYHAAESFENQIVPFANSGYEFFVCPGVNNWNRILPDFAVATTNIRNFVRDGAKHGCLGMLNTAWDDDGETLNGPNWHGFAWGAECAWNASTTEPEAFNRRVGAVLFGEPGDHFGRAIELLTKTHALPGMDHMFDRRFWKLNLDPKASTEAAMRNEARQLLAIVQPAIEHLEACRGEATVNTHLLDCLLYGARRMELIGRRTLDQLDAAADYARAAKSPKPEPRSLVGRAEQTIRRLADAHEALGRQFEELWLRENRPYALDWTMKRYANAVETYRDLADRLAAAGKDLEAGRPLPLPKDVGL